MSRLNHPQTCTELTVLRDLQISRPQHPFGDSSAAPPPTIGFEIYEETVGVFGNLVYNDGVTSGNVVVKEN